MTERHKNPSHVLQHLVCLFLLLTSLSITAELTEMSEQELSDITGQSIVRVTRLDSAQVSNSFNPTRPNGGDTNLAFTRVEMGLDIEINANINELVLGRYGTSPSYTSPEIHRGFLGTGPVVRPPKTYNVDADVIIQNFNIGTITGGTLNNATIRDPYLEFAFETDANNNPTTLAGFRMGFKDMSADMSSELRILSGDIALTANATVLGLPVTISASSHTARATEMAVTGISIGGINPGIGAADQTLSAYNNFTVTNANNFYISAQDRAINYPKIGAGPQGQAQPGFWMNMQDGVSLNATLGSTGFLQLAGYSDYKNNCFNGTVGAGAC